MAWTCSGTSNDELISNLTSSKLITSPEIATALRKVDRANYVPDKSMAYRDSPQPIGFNATISAPHMHVAALENLLPFMIPSTSTFESTVDASERERDGWEMNSRDGRRVVLDVGCGSGYLTSAIYHILNPDKSTSSPNLVVGIDHLPELTALTFGNMKKDGLDHAWAEHEGEEDVLRGGSVKIVTGDGRQGYPSLGPYDAIHVGAAAPTLPRALVDQLKSPGRMFIPIGTLVQEIFQVDKDKDGKVTMKRLMGVRYVPLTDKDSQWKDGQERAW